MRTTTDYETPKFGVTTNPARFVHRAAAFILREFREMLPPTIFFFIGFNLIVLTTNLILADYSVAFSSFMLATAAALVVGKSVLVANAMAVLGSFARRWSNRSYSKQYSTGLSSSLRAYLNISSGSG